jgi:hypothetical protein
VARAAGAIGQRDHDAVNQRRWHASRPCAKLAGPALEES